MRWPAGTFTERGIPAERLELRHEIPADGHLAVYGDVDVSLDVFPWTGVTTTCESLWMGVPIITLYGSRHASRGTASTLVWVGLTEFVAQTPEAYVDLAVRWAGDLERLAVLRSELRRLMGATMCDGKRFTRELDHFRHIAR